MMQLKTTVVVTQASSSSSAENMHLDDIRTDILILQTVNRSKVSTMLPAALPTSPQRTKLQIGLRSVNGTKTMRGS